MAVAQLVRAPGCDPGGRGFEPRRPPSVLRATAVRPYHPGNYRRLQFHAPLAQRQSNGLLIRRFWVRIPGGAPRRHRTGEARIERPVPVYRCDPRSPWATSRATPGVDRRATDVGRRSAGVDWRSTGVDRRATVGDRRRGPSTGVPATRARYSDPTTAGTTRLRRGLPGTPPRFGPPLRRAAVRTSAADVPISDAAVGRTLPEHTARAAVRIGAGRRGHRVSGWRYPSCSR